MKSVLVCGACLAVLTVAPPTWAQHEGHGPQQPGAQPPAEPTRDNPPASDQTPGMDPNMPGMHMPAEKPAQPAPTPMPTMDHTGMAGMPGMDMGHAMTG